ncbi:hypothetical protein S83_053424 [Arachis hypogaea]
MPAMLRDWDLCCGLQTLTKSVSPAACFKATDESHRTSSATAVAATKVQSSSFQASSLSIAACAIRVHGKGSWEQIFFGLICQIHLKIGGSSQEEISLGFMSLFLSLILGNNKLDETNELCLVSTDSVKLLSNLTRWKECWKITLRIIRIWSLIDYTDLNEEHAFLQLLIMDKEILFQAENARIIAITNGILICVMDEDLFLMVRSGVCSDGGGTTRNMFLALHKVVLRIRKRKSLLEEVDKILEAQI